MSIISKITEKEVTVYDAKRVFILVFSGNNTGIRERINFAASIAKRPLTCNSESHRYIYARYNPSSDTIIWYTSLDNNKKRYKVKGGHGESIACIAKHGFIFADSINIRHAKGGI
jgi:hypothetical protein